MIDEARTLEIFGYTSDGLKPKSNKPVVAVCEECGRVRVMRRGVYKNMCPGCNRKRVVPIMTHCIQCGKDVRVYPSQTTSKKFCSRTCKGVWQSINIRGASHPLYGKKIPRLTGVNNPNYKPKRDIVCAQCGKCFKVMAGDDTAKFCSYKCHGEWKSVHNKGTDNPNYGNGCAISGTRNPFYGKKHTDIAKIAMSCTKRGIDIGDWGGFAPPPDRLHVLKTVYCTKINEPFPGCEGHHLSRSLIIFIPKDLHNHVRHNLKTGKGMAAINALALQYIFPTGTFIYP